MLALPTGSPSGRAALEICGVSARPARTLSTFTVDQTQMLAFSLKPPFFARMGVLDNLLRRVLWLALGTIPPHRSVLLSSFVSFRTAHEGQGDVPSTSLAEIIPKIEA